ncbi:MAG: hypothetical protein JNL19_04180 [Burkholderiales bacterium]|nr:hypothetical protein [Burkholderiales bacterium]
MFKSSFGSSLSTAFLLAFFLTGCSTPPRSVDASGAVRRTVAELGALRPSSIAHGLTSASGERAVYETEIATMRSTFALPPGAEADEKLPSALNTALHFNTDLDTARERVLAALPRAAAQPPAWQRAVLSAAHAQFPREAAPLIPPLLPLIRTPREFAIAAYTLLRAADTPGARSQITDALRNNFPAAEEEPRLRALMQRLQSPAGVARPPLADLLASPPRPRYPVVYSFQRKDRARAGLAVVRGADGRFVRNADGSLFSIAQYALARTHLPGTITNGNTPQGVFVIKGTGSATNRWIGPTPYLESMLPVEAPLALFDNPQARDTLPKLSDEDNRRLWTEAAYLALLPAAWRGWGPMSEALLAGQAGRDEILAHGNAINTAYYRNEAWYPTAPSAGCLVAAEYWSRDDGTLVHSDQLALVKAFVASGMDVGYLIVVELDDAPRPVVVADIIADVFAAERRSALGER